VSYFRDRLEAFPRLADYRLAKAAGYWPYYKTVESASRPRFRIEGQDYINFGSNNYLSLSYHPRVIEAAQRATARYGTGVTGSRLLNGTLDLHRELEAELADFYEAEAALVFSTGYVANVSTISALLGRHDYVVLDKDAHNSLLTGAQLSGATMKRFGHNDLERLARILDDLARRGGQGRDRRRRVLDGRRHRPPRRPRGAVPGAPELVPARRRGARPRGPR
jgi:8-amino-7-oxononanoate synthase